MNLQDIIIALDNIGLRDVLLPFILIFAIVFAVLSNINLFGKDKKNINVVIALVLALTVVIPHVTGTYPPGGDVVDIMNKAMPNVSLIIVAVIMLLLLVGVWGIKFTGEGSSFKGIIAFASIGIVVYLFGSAAGWFGNSMFIRMTANPETVAVVVALLIFGIIIFAITSEPKDPNSKNFLGSMMKDFNDSWKK
jgi:uncharacterized membrane protein YozB (DUF420 family)